MNEFSKLRKEALIIRSITALLSKGAIKDPRIDPLLSIVRVELSSDGTSAKVYVSSLVMGPSLLRSVEGLGRAAGFIQSRLAKVLQSRNTPRLHFFATQALEESFFLNQTLDRLSQENTATDQDLHEETSQEGLSS